MRRSLLGIALISGLIGSLSGCSEQSKQQGDWGIITIDHDKIYQENGVDLAQFCTDKLEIIKLETNEDVLLAEGCEFSVGDNEIYYSGNFEDAALYRFDGKGNYLNKICSTGRGPGELTCIIQWTEYCDSIMFYNNIDNKILIYDKLGTGFREIFSNADTIEAKKELIKFEDDKHYMLYVDDPYRLHVYDKESNTTTRFIPQDSIYTKNAWQLTFGNIPTDKDGNLYFSQWNVDTIYTYNISTGVAKSAYYIDIVNRIDPKRLINVDYDLFQNLTSSKYIWNHRFYGMSDKNLFIQYNFGTRLFNAIYSIESGKIVSSKIFTVDGLPAYHYKVQDNKIYFVMGANELMEIIPEVLNNDSVSDNIKSLLKQLLSEIDEESNPVMFVKQFK